jgi:hypothetical protein
MNLCLVRAAFCVAILVEVCPALTANPQDSGGAAPVVIEVQDPGGNRIPGAQVTIAPLPVGLAATLTADEKGTLSVQLPWGSYDVNVTFLGFRKETRHIDVQQATEQTIPITLEVATFGGPASVVVECSQPDLTAALLPTDPAYNDAAELTRKLNGLGLHVRCTLASKMQHIFAGQSGAAFYRADIGDFETLFLPQGESFDRLKVIERQKRGRYLYSFRGTPHSKVHMDGSKPSYFIKKRNVLFYVWGDDQIAATLRSKLNE